MGPSDLQRALRSLCFNTEWKYAVFWRLKHRARMVLTCEDAYYDKSEQHHEAGDTCFSGTMENLRDGSYIQDPLGFAVAKMSYLVHSLGEGIVGQVAASGKYQWVLADNHKNISCSSFENSDCWKSQISAGISTIAFVAVAPHGVVQLGSFDKVIESVDRINHIKGVLMDLQYSLEGDVRTTQSSINNTMNSQNKPSRSFTSEDFPDSLHHLEKTLNGERPDIWHSIFPYLVKDDDSAYTFSRPSNNEAVANGVSYCKDVSMGSLGNLITSGKVLEDPMHFSCGPSDLIFQNVMENMQTVLSDVDESSTSLNFPAGYELHEALGPAFLKKSKYFESMKDEEVTPEKPKQSIHLTSDSYPENLLEAVIANVCESQNTVKSEKSFHKLVQSFSETETYLEPSCRTTVVTDSSNRSAGQQIQQCLSSSGISGVMSPKGFSSTCLSACSEQFERSSAMAKNNKKRARPGENSRPRPRDRQLIQDRIKELRDLIPSGAKCSIDSLLERTIKHMLYLQSVTKHADKLNKYSDIKETSVLEPSTFERGSSWAVEVGGNLKVCSIIVENLNKNGQMVVEMMCEECSHFLEIAETIKSLGLKILKGATEAHGEKTWICFVVEGESNRSLHRMDILWSLVQKLQPNNTIMQ